MSQVHQDQNQNHEPSGGHDTGHGGHGWMMIVCCIPMLIIAIALAAAGVVSSGFIVYALVCTAMMGGMMYAMNHKGMKM